MLFLQIPGGDNASGACMGLPHMIAEVVIAYAACFLQPSNVGCFFCVMSRTGSIQLVMADEPANAQAGINKGSSYLHIRSLQETHRNDRYCLLLLSFVSAGCPAADFLINHALPSLYSSVLLLMMCSRVACR